jgi:hypothetical protein
MREARARSVRLSFTRLVQRAAILGLLLFAYGKSEPAAPLLAVGELPLSKAAAARPTRPRGEAISRNA